MSAPQEIEGVEEECDGPGHGLLPEVDPSCYAPDAVALPLVLDEE